MSTGNKLLLIVGGVIIVLLAAVLIMMPASREEPKDQEPTQEKEIIDNKAPIVPSRDEEVPADVQAQINALKDLIVIESPKPGSVVSSPLKVTGKARGTWFFEASFPVALVNWDGLIIAETPAQAQGEWMTEEFVPFETTITFETPDDTGDFSDRGAIILQKDNPSGLPEHDAALEIPVRFR